MALMRTVLVLAAVLVCPVASTAQQDSRSFRIVELLRMSCSNSLGLREVTLFGNGTLRLRDGLGDDIKMWLHELEPQERDAFVQRLLEDTWDETQDEYRSIDGDWIENCELILDLPGQVAHRHSFGRYDSLSLTLQRAVSIAQEMIVLVDQTRRPEGESEIPRDYEPRVGDLLINEQGHRYRLIAFTWEGEGVELQGLDQPLTMYLSFDGLRQEFVQVRRKGRQ
ncbi:MAG: hypothetical protein AAF690_18845 [Acidobacteriota bacterium]